MNMSSMNRSFSPTKNANIQICLNSFDVLIKQDNGYFFRDKEHRVFDFGFRSDDISYVSFSLQPTILNTLDKIGVNEKVSIDKYVENYKIIAGSLLEFTGTPKFYLTRTKSSFFEIEIMQKFKETDSVLDKVCDGCIKQFINFTDIINEYKILKKELDIYKKELEPLENVLLKDFEIYKFMADEKIQKQLFKRHNIVTVGDLYKAIEDEKIDDDFIDYALKFLNVIKDSYCVDENLILKALNSNYTAEDNGVPVFPDILDCYFSYFDRSSSLLLNLTYWMRYNYFDFSKLPKDLKQVKIIDVFKTLRKPKFAIANDFNRTEKKIRNLVEYYEKMMPPSKVEHEEEKVNDDEILSTNDEKVETENNYKNILIKDLDIYDEADYNLFHRLGIITVENLLDKDLMWKIPCILRPDTKKRLNAYINLVGYKYENKPIVYDELLNQDINFVKNEEGELTLDIISNHALSVLGFSAFEMKEIINSLDFSNLSENLTKMKLIDIFRRVRKEELGSYSYLTNTLEKIKLYIDYYDKMLMPLQEETKEISIDTLANLKEMLNNLLEQRNSLDNQILSIQQQIENIDKQKGGNVK